MPFVTGKWTGEGGSGVVFSSDKEMGRSNLLSTSAGSNPSYKSELVATMRYLTDIGVLTRPSGTSSLAKKKT